MLNLPRFYFWTRNKPVSCRSRWMKTLVRRNRHRTVVSASPRSIFMKVIEHPKTEADRERIAEEQAHLLLMCGIAVIPMPITPLMPFLKSKQG